MKNSCIIWLTTLLCAFVAVPTGTSNDENAQQTVNFMIDVSGVSDPTGDQQAVYEEQIKNIYNAMIGSKIPSTMFLTKNVSSSPLSLYLTQLGLYGNIEFGLSGTDSSETLSTMSYSEQLAILKDSKKYADTCHVCGKNEKPILGFRPQSYDQNQDTYKALDEMGIEYNAGFQAGLLYEPGHENDVWPYLVEGHNFYAVPVSTYSLSGETVPLQDSYFKDNGLSADQWYNALAGKLDEIQGKNEPLVIALTVSVSGSDDYLDAFTKFITYAQSKNAGFVYTKQLVEMAKLGIYDPSALPETNVTECLTCNEEKSGIDSEELENLITTRDTNSTIGNNS